MILHIKKMIAMITVFVAMPCFMHYAYAEDFSRPDFKILLDGKLLSSPSRPELIQGKPYVPLRYLSERQGAHVLWNARTRQATVKKNGKTRYPRSVLRKGVAYVEASFMQEMFGLKANYMQDLNVLLLTSNGKQYSKSQVLELLPQYKGYSHEDLYWLSKIIEAEARGETYDSKLGVANVILNRVGYSAYPNTIKAVIFDAKNGIQFTPVMNGSVHKNPSNESILAAIEALEGKNNAGDTLFFLNPKFATSTWVQNNRKYAFTIGGHSYFY